MFPAKVIQTDKGIIIFASTHSHKEVTNTFSLDRSFISAAGFVRASTKGLFGYGNSFSLKVSMARDTPLGENFIELRLCDNSIDSVEKSVFVSDLAVVENTNQNIFSTTGKMWRAELMQLDGMSMYLPVSDHLTDVELFRYFDLVSDF